MSYPAKPMKYRPRSKETYPRKQQIIPVSEAISSMFSSLHLEDKFYEAKVLCAWKEVVGEVIAKRTLEIEIYRGKLTIKLNSAALKSELSMSRELIKNRLNEFVGKEVVKNVVFL